MHGIKISFNGNEKEVSSSNLSALLEEFDLASRPIAVELNREIVARANYTKTIIKDGDVVEIVQFVGGG